MMKDKKQKYIRTNIEINDFLIKEVMQAYKLKSKKDAVNMALEDFYRKNKQKEVLGLFGKVQWEGDLSELKKNRVFE